ncbi:MAG TPA: carboxylating nicotinate-nucleotide diphosphorylase [Vicinamibacterales bacterium]|nr:carboxylating nicotinate-nucleotide diphosphorylase [Vicinamibacterales bacterium]
MTPLDPEVYLDLVRRALAEDIGDGDRTTLAIVPASARATAAFVAHRACVVAGLDVAAAAFTTLDPSTKFEPRVADGKLCQAGDLLAAVSGSARTILAAERTALNFLQQLSGVATLTRRFVDAAGGRITVLDTRKTTPGLRVLEKYAVRCGGGTNHRFGLFDAVLIKDNHIHIAGGVAEAVRRARAGSPGPIEVEAQSLREVDDALAAGADTIMLDNLTPADMAEAVGRIAGRARVEISGGVTLESLAGLLALGADVVSVGAITHSAPAADISLEIDVDVERPAR